MTALVAHEPARASMSRSETGPSELRAGPQLSPAIFSAVRRRAVLDGCKWDPQVADVNTLTPFPLVMKKSAWRRIADQAELLAAETISAEEEILSRPELLNELGLPSALLRVLAGGKPMTPALGRVMRFDFHYTTDGWRISEVNSDVPGGFTEASEFTAMMAENYTGVDGLRSPTLSSKGGEGEGPNGLWQKPLNSIAPAGNPAGMWSDALAAGAGPSGVVALVSAPGYMEDHQVIAYLARKLRERGCQAHLANPRQIVWHDGIGHLDAAWYRGPVDAIVRFYQAEWLARLPARTGWAYFFRGGKTAVANPASSVISESKRFPLLWNKLSSPMCMWNALLPETRDPRDVSWERDSQWLLKRSICNTGDAITMPDCLLPRLRLRTRLAVKVSPCSWVAQRRFKSVPVSTPFGPRHVCVGIYTVNGKAAGGYARISEKAVIDFEAADVALLLEDDD